MTKKIFIAIGSLVLAVILSYFSALIFDYWETQEWTALDFFKSIYVFLFGVIIPSVMLILILFFIVSHD